MNYNDVNKILIYKRNTIEMNLIEKYTISINNNNIEVKTFNGIKKIEKNKVNTILSNLYEYIKDMEKTRYQVQLFEYEINNPAIKFFVCFQFKNNTYIAIKGIEPLTQIHYKDILNEIDNFLKLLD